jgi:hypothetical protein
MSYADLDRRVTRLEARLTDIEDSHGGSIYLLTREVRRSELTLRRLAGQGNGLGRGIAMIMGRLGLPPIDIPEVTAPTEEEVDASFEDES